MADNKSSNGVGVSAAGMGMEPSREEGNKNIGETLLRLLPIGLCLSALVIMLKNSQSNDFGSLAYSDVGAFRS